MRLEYIEPVIDSTVRVLDAVIQSDVAKGRLILLGGNEILADLVIVIRLKGVSDGSIIINMDSHTAINLCSIMNGVRFDSITPLGIDTISELANMIAGNAVSVLNDMGLDFSVSPPVVIINDKIQDFTQGLEIFQLPLFTECGEIMVNVAFRTS